MFILFVLLEFGVRSTYYLDSKQVAGTKERQPRRTEFYPKGCER